jgi:Flp pilus assembly protein TadG
MSSRTPLLRRLRADAQGVAAVEFALVAPILILLYCVGFEVSEAATVYRKLTDTTIQIANVTSQYTTMASSDVSLVESASSEIMTPFSTAPFSVVLSEVSTNASGQGTVTWSQACSGSSCTAGTGLATGASVTMPAGFQTPNANYILVQTTYAYTPVIAGNFIGNLNMTGQFFMLPRNSPSIAYTG